MAQQAPPLQNFEAHAEAINAQYFQDEAEFRGAVNWVIKFASIYPEQIYGESPSPSEREIGAQIIFTGLGKLLDEEVRQSLVKIAYEKLEQEEFTAKHNEKDIIGGPTALIEALENSFPDEIREVKLLPEEKEIEKDDRLPVITNKSPIAAISQFLASGSGLADIELRTPHLSEAALRQGTDEVLNAAVALHAVLTATNTKLSEMRLGNTVGGGRYLLFEKNEAWGIRKDNLLLRACTEGDGSINLHRREINKSASESIKRNTNVVSGPNGVEGKYVFFVPVEETAEKKQKNDPKILTDPITDPDQLLFMSRAILGGLVTELERRVQVFSARFGSVSEAVEALKR